MDKIDDIIFIMAQISIVVPTYNNFKGLRYLFSYFKDKKSYQLIIVDNGKVTQNPKLKIQIKNLKLKDKRFIVLPQEKNLGFAKAVNLGAKYVDSEWMVVMNDDIKFKNPKSEILNPKQIQNSKFKMIKRKKDILEDLKDYAEKNNLNAVSPVLKNPDGRVENIGYKILPYGKIELITQISNLKSQKHNLKLKTVNSITELDGLTAACLLIKTKVFKKLGGFDESFFAYLEDVEFFIRFKKAGFRFGIAPIEVLHYHMTTSKTMGSFKARQDMINWWRLAFKHPDMFRFDIKFFIERLRNVSGYLKSLNSFAPRR